MLCRKCGAEIADKALICYRCGTATTEAKYQPAAVRARSSRRAPIIIIVALLLVLLLIGAYLYLRTTPQPAAPPPAGAKTAPHELLAELLVVPFHYESQTRPSPRPGHIPDQPESQSTRIPNPDPRIPRMR